MAITFDRDALDARIKKLEPSLAFRTDFGDLRDAAFAQAIAEYWKAAIDSDLDWVRDSNYASPLATGTETIDTTVHDIFEIALPSDQVRVAGTVIWLQQSTGVFLKVPRMAPTDILLSGDETLYAFYENKQKIILIVKDAEFTAPANLCYDFYRYLETTLATGADLLDIRPEDFEQMAQRVSELMIQGL